MDRTTAPESNEILMPPIPVSQELVLPNGVECTVLNQGSQLVVLLELVYPIGRVNETQPGISYFLAKMLTEGTRTRTSEQIASTFDFYGSHLEIAPTLDTINIKLYTLSRFLPELAKILFELIRESTFPEQEFEVVKGIRVQQILQQHAKNNAFAGLKFREVLFGAGHPYGEVITEQKASAISVNQVRDFAKALKVKPHIFLAGQVGESEINVLSEIFGNSTFDSPEISSFSSASASGKSEEITREDSTQASIKLGNHTISRSHADIHKLKITNSLFGGFFGSRLMKNIREEKGLTYGIHSSLIHLQEASYWQVSTEVLRDKLDLAKDEIVKEIKQLQDNAPSEDELHTVVSYMKGKLLTTFDTPFNAMNAIKHAKLAGHGPEYFHAYEKALNEVTIQDISAMAGKYFDVDSIVSVVVK